MLYKFRFGDIIHVRLGAFDYVMLGDNVEESIYRYNMNIFNTNIKCRDYYHNELNKLIK